MSFIKSFSTLICIIGFTSIVQGQYSGALTFSQLPSFSFPIEMVQVNDGTERWFVVQQRGLIYTFANDTNTAQRKLFLNLSGIVSQTGSETGLLGLAFHPAYSQNGYFYVCYTRTVAGQLKSFVSRYSVSGTNPDSAVAGSEFVILSVDQPYSNHNGGNILFGPDSLLYISLGDGGSANDPQNRAQNRTSLLGKILRINVNQTTGSLNYSIPPTNPFVGNSSGFREEIFAYGIRNAWKMSFDLPTGRLWAGDVGQNNFEEINIIRNGENYGWRLMEAFSCFNPSTNCNPSNALTLPVFAYGHSNNNVSITGGFVYRGSAIPLLAGRYVYGDYVSGRVWALTYDSATATTSNQLLFNSQENISTFAKAANGDLYYCSYGPGRIYRITGPSSPAGIAVDKSVLGRVEIYPNPAKNELRVQVQNLLSGKQAPWKLSDIQGKILAYGDLSNLSKQEGQLYSINLPEIRPGVYYFSLTQQGDTLVRKLIIE